MVLKGDLKYIERYSILSDELMKFGKNSRLSSTQTFVLWVGIFVVFVFCGVFECFRSLNE